MSFEYISPSNDILCGCEAKDCLCSDELATWILEGGALCAACIDNYPEVHPGKPTRSTTTTGGN